jgi:DNA-binding MarR family transcriptional regulator
MQPKAMDDLFLYRISRLLATAGAQVIRLCEGEFGITRREWRIVALLAQEQGILSSELALRAQLDRARTSRAVTALVAKQLLSRVTRAGDRRAATLALTQAGLALYTALFPRVVAINRELLSVLGEAEVATLDSVLGLLQGHADGLAREVHDGPKADRRRGGRRARFAG